MNTYRVLNQHHKHCTVPGCFGKVLPTEDPSHSPVGQSITCECAICGEFYLGEVVEKPRESRGKMEETDWYEVAKFMTRLR